MTKVVSSRQAVVELSMMLHDAGPELLAEIYSKYAAKDAEVQVVQYDGKSRIFENGHVLGEKPLVVNPGGRVELHIHHHRKLTGAEQVFHDRARHDLSGGEDHVAVDDDVLISPVYRPQDSEDHISQPGAWVSAWVWIPLDGIHLTPWFEVEVRCSGAAIATDRFMARTGDDAYQQALAKYREVDPQATIAVKSLPPLSEAYCVDVRAVDQHGDELVEEARGYVYGAQSVQEAIASAKAFYGETLAGLEVHVVTPGDIHTSKSYSVRIVDGKEEISEEVGEPVSN